MTHLKRLMESLPFLTRMPDQSVLNGESGKGIDHAQATRDTDGNYMLIYLPTGKPVSVHLDKLRGPEVKAFWFNPQDGTARRIGEFLAQGTREFTPPTHGGGNDWVLVIKK